MGTNSTTQAKFRNIPPPRRAGARYFAMDAGEDVGEASAAGRPAPLLEVLPQERVQQREQIVDLVVLLLHDVMPQMVEQLVDFLTPLDFPVPEQVIEVPKIVCPPRAARTVLDVPQTAEQLVEAPTIVSLIEVIRSLSSSPLTFQFALGVVLVDVFKIFSLDIFPPRLWSRSLTFQFLMVASRGF